MKILKIVFISISILVLFGCNNKNIIGAIQEEYNYLYKDKNYNDNYLQCMNISREKLLKLFFAKNDVKDQKVFLIELYNEQYKDMHGFIYTDKSHIEEYFYRNPHSSCNSVYEIIPTENLDNEFYRFIIKKSEEGKFNELLEGYINFPISNAGVVYLTIIDIENKKKFKILKSLIFQEYREY